MRNFELENRYVLDLVQAMLGSISENFRAIWLEVTQEKVGFTFVLQAENADDRDSIAEIMFEFEALQAGYTPNEVEIIVSEEAIVYPPEARLVFVRKSS